MSPGPDFEPAFEPEDSQDFVLEMAIRAVRETWDDWRLADLRDVVLVVIDAAFEAAV